MSNKYPIEALLRPPVELFAGISSLACALLVAIAPEIFMLIPPAGYGSAVLLTLISAYWFKEGLYIVRYQKNLRRLNVFEAQLNKIPLSNSLLFLGKGFAWHEKHTQRLHDSRRTQFQKFVKPNSLVTLLREQEKNYPDHWLYKLTAKDSLLNPVRPLPSIGGNTVLHGVELDEQNVYMPLSDRSGHTLVLGTTRVGKTRLLETLVSQDIRRGEIVIVFDPKGDSDLLKTVYNMCEKSGRLDDFYMFHLGYPDISARYNAVGQFNRITEVATRISGQLSGEGQSAVFREFAWRFINIVAKALVALGDRPDYRTILKHVNNVDALFIEYAENYLVDDEESIEAVEHIKERIIEKNLPRHMQGRDHRVVAFEQFFMETGKGDDVLEGLRSAFKYERTYFDKIVASLLPLLEKLTTGKVAELLSPEYLNMEDERPIFDWKKVINQRAVVYVGLDALSDTSVSSAVGNSMFSDLVSYVGERYKHGDTHGFRRTENESIRPIVVHMDEFNELMGNEFIPMVNKGGAAGMQITAYSQTFSDIEAKAGSEAKARQVSGNFNNLIMFRVKDIQTADILTNQLPTANVTELTLIAGYNDSSDPDSEVDFTSRHEDRISSTQTTLLEPHDVMKLPKGQAFALLEGGKLYKLRLPLPKAASNPKGSSNKDFANDFLKLTETMKERYRTGSTWWMSSDTGGV